ncbi:MAG: sigma-70 family RNA polymerase sigma factor [Ignavibacteriales bacterium]|nr:sigma-70 family RNA polymerase sigma factor [Ignavibacteriales bacterium]
MQKNNAELWQQFKQNQSPILKKQIILNYVNLVHYVIHHSKFAINSILDERDYFQYGIEGLNEAIDRFDPDYGTKFETYAIQRIRGKIIDELRKLQSKFKNDSNESSIESFYTNVSLSRSPEDEDGYTLGEVIANDTESAATTVEKTEMKEYLMSAIKDLQERDRLLLSLYYFENLNYKEIAELMKITVSRVSQIHSRIMKDLKSKLLVLND